MTSNISSIVSFITESMWYRRYVGLQLPQTVAMDVSHWYTPIQVVIHSQTPEDLWYIGAKAPKIDYSRENIYIHKE